MKKLMTFFAAGIFSAAVQAQTVTTKPHSDDAKTTQPQNVLERETNTMSPDTVPSEVRENESQRVVNERKWRKSQKDDRASRIEPRRADGKKMEENEGTRK